LQLDYTTPTGPWRSSTHSGQRSRPRRTSLQQWI